MNPEQRPVHLVQIRFVPAAHPGNSGHSTCAQVGVIRHAGSVGHGQLHRRRTTRPWASACLSHGRPAEAHRSGGGPEDRRTGCRTGPSHGPTRHAVSGYYSPVGNQLQIWSTRTATGESLCLCRDRGGSAAQSSLGTIPRSGARRSATWGLQRRWRSFARTECPVSPRPRSRRYGNALASTRRLCY